MAQYGEEDRYLLFKLALCLGFQPRFALVGGGLNTKGNQSGGNGKVYNECGEELMFRRESVCHGFLGRHCRGVPHQNMRARAYGNDSLSRKSI